jgi:hypothetical protein
LAGRQIQISGKPDAGAPEAMRAIARPHDGRAMIAIAIASMNTHSAARSDTSGPVGTGRTGGSVGFGDLNSKQAEN